MLGTHVVGVHDEALGMGVQHFAELGVILQIVSKFSRGMISCFDTYIMLQFCYNIELKSYHRRRRLLTYLLLFNEFCGGRHDCVCFFAGPDRGVAGR